MHNSESSLWNKYIIHWWFSCCSLLTHDTNWSSSCLFSASHWVNERAQWTVHFDGMRKMFMSTQNTTKIKKECYWLATSQMLPLLILSLPLALNKQENNSTRNPQITLIPENYSNGFYEISWLKCTLRMRLSEKRGIKSSIEWRNVQQ